MKITIKTFRFLAIAAFFLVSTFWSQAVAQQYFVYDGDTFSVLITTDRSNKVITKVEFSDDNKWHEFKILDYEDLEDTNEGGFVYEVVDGVGNIYFVDYYRDEDYIMVHSEDLSTSWTLTRRDD